MINPYEQISIDPEVVARLLADWSEPVQVKAYRQANGALDLAFRTYSPPVMRTTSDASVVNAAVRKRKEADRASDQ